MDFPIESSNTELLEKAKYIAMDYAKKPINDETAGIVILGGTARGYFDADADIDISILKNGNMPEVKITYEIIDGMEVQTFTAGYENDKEAKWEMDKRCVYSNRTIFHDTNKRIEDLLKKKVPLRDEERKWLMISGTALSEWYCVRLPDL
jgi:predicted nucleotidyltransferase